MAEESVIRIVIQGSGGQSTGTSQGTSAPGAGQAGSIYEQERNKELLGRIARSTREAAVGLEKMTDSLRRMDGATGGIVGGALKSILGKVTGLISEVISFPGSVIGDFKNTIKKEFSKSFIKGMGGDAFGEEVGKILSGNILEAFGYKGTGDMMGREAAKMAVDWVNKKLDDWFGVEPPKPKGAGGLDNGGGPGPGPGPGDGGGDGGGDTYPFAPPEAGAPEPQSKAEGAAKWFKREYAGLRKVFSEKQQAADRPTVDPEQAAGAEDIPQYATGGKVKSTGLAFIHAGETVLPVAQPDQSGPGKLSSDLDVITQALGLGPALKEVTYSAHEAAASLAQLPEALEDLPVAPLAPNQETGVTSSLPGAITKTPNVPVAPPDVKPGLDKEKLASGAATGAAAAASGFIVAQVAMYVAGKIKDTLKGLIGAAFTVKDLVSSPETDPGAQLSHVADAALDAAEKLGGLGVTLEYAGGIMKDFAVVMQNLNKTADRYGEYSPAIAQAQGMAEITQVMGDLRRAQTLGPEMVKYLQAQSDLQQKFEDTKIRILMKLMPAITHMVNILEKTVPGAEAIANCIIALLKPLNLISSAAGAILGVQEDAQRQDIGDPVDQLLKDDVFDKVGLGTAQQPGLVPRL